MIDNMYPDNLPPEYGIPLVMLLLVGYAALVIRDRRADVKRRRAMREGN